MSTQKPVAHRTKLHKDERRQSIVRNAARAFVQKGYESTTLEDIMRAAGVSRTLFYRHFKSKEGVYVAILADFQIHFSAAPSGRPRAIRAPEALIQAAQLDPDGFQLVFRYARYEAPFHERFAILEARRQKFIAESLRARISDDTRRAFAAKLINELAIGTVLTWIDAGMPDPEHMPDILRGVRRSIVVELTNKE